MCTHAVCLSGAGCPYLRLPALQLTVQPRELQPFAEEFPSVSCQRKPPANIWRFQIGVHSWGWSLVPAALPPHPLLPFQDSWVQIISPSLLGFGCGLGGAFPLAFRALRFNFCHCSFSFYCNGGTFLSLQHLLTSQTDNAVGGSGRQSSSSEVTPLCREGALLSHLPPWIQHPCCAKQSCQFRLPSLSPLCHQCSSPCFPPPRESSRGQRDLQYQIQSRIYFGAPLVGQLATPCLPQTWSLTTLSIHTSDLSSPPLLGTSGFIITRLHNVKERLFALFHK